MGVNSLPKTVTRQHHDYDLNPGPSAPESSTITTRLPSHPLLIELWLNIADYWAVKHVRACVLGSRRTSSDCCWLIV